MSNEVFVPYGDSASDTATLLLAGQEKLELEPWIVRSVEGGFMVPSEVADEAGLDYESDDDDEPADEDDSAEESKPAPRKRAAKKTAAK